MVDIRIHGGEAIVTPRGWSRFWTFRRRLAFPLSAIFTVRRASSQVGRGWYKGIRFPGTHLPGVMVAGRFYRNGGWDFWDVRARADRAIEIELEGQAFRRLIVDVADPDGEVARIEAAVKRRASGARAN